VSADVVDTADQPLTVKEAVALLSALQPSQVLPVLRHPDFMMVGGLAFAGFRQDATSFSNPIVRRRLAEEAAKNQVFATKLRNLSKEPKPLPTAPVAASSKAGPGDAVQSGDSARETEKYRQERDRLKLERDTAIQARQAAERLLTEAKRDLVAAQSSKAEREREADRLKQRLERVERKQRQLEATNAALRRAAIKVSPTETFLPEQTPTVPTAAETPTSAPFADAVRHLLGKQKEQLALSIVSDVLRAAPDDSDALGIKADALIKTEKARDAVPVLRSLIPLLLKKDQFAPAATNLYKLLLITPQPSQEIRLIRSFMAALPRSTDRLGKLAEPLNALRTEQPAAFDLMKSLTPSAWINQLFPEQTVFPPDAALPLIVSSLVGVVLTSRKLVAAVDRNDLPMVELARDALRSKEPEERDKIFASVTRAADGDEVYARVLSPKISRGPIVVDSSNVAWHGQENNAQQQPRLGYVLAIRRALWQRGYFPVVLIADANLPYVTDDSTLVRKMVEEEQIQLVISGSDADEQILREAQRLQAPVVTNDYMVDWDPNQNVTKLQYTFSPDGKPSVYF
jgi:hypothetical protein